MGRRVGVSFALALLLSQKAAGGELLPPITLRVCDMAGVPDAVRVVARREVGRIFTKAGIEALWVDCMVDSPKESPCRQKLTRADLIVHVLNRTSTTHTAHLFGTGLALPDGLGQYATIFYAEIRSRADHDETLGGRILGYAIAHEVGHLMLADRNHAPAGIMTTNWTATAIRFTSKEFFRFTDGEAEDLRANVRTRWRDAAENEPLEQTRKP